MEEKFLKKFENRVRKTIEMYNLIDKNDKVIVACSGGKDSTTVLYLLQKFGYNVEALIIDLLIGEWSKKNIKNIKNFCTDIGVKLHVVNIRDELNASMCYIRSTIQEKSRLSNCYVCGVIKRWILNRKAKELMANKIATGHNLDDEVETILMNIFKGDIELALTMGPKTGINKVNGFVTRVKPLYFCTNNDVKRYSIAMNFPVVYDPCPCSFGSFRRDMRKLVELFSKGERRKKEWAVLNFLSIIEKLKKSTISSNVKNCEICGEPTRKNVCKTCELLLLVKK